jgi:hypothetical protein
MVWQVWGLTRIAEKGGVAAFATMNATMALATESQRSSSADKTRKAVREQGRRTARGHG